MNSGNRIRKVLTVLVISGILLLAACASAIGNTPVRAEEPKATVRVVGYLPTWTYHEYTNIDFGALTHINISFCNVGAGGDIVCDIPQKDLNKIVEKAHAENVKVMAAIGGADGGDPYRDLTSSSESIESLNGKIVAFCEKYNLDGVDLDIELGAGDRVWNNYAEWVSGLRSICDERGWELSTATAQWVAHDVSAATFAKFDYINVMAYDNDTRGSTSHSSYEFSVECMNYFYNTKQVPKNKLVLGVPFYGMGYKSNGELDWGSYESFENIVKADAANYDRDVYNGIVYTGAATMRRKCELAKEYGGIMIWELTQDAAGEYSLLAVIKDELFPTPPPDTEDTPVTPNANVGIKTVWIVVISIVGAATAAAVVLIVIFLIKRKKNT